VSDERQKTIRLAAQIMKNLFEQEMADVSPRGLKLLLENPEFVGVANGLPDDRLGSLVTGLSRTPTPRPTAAPKPHVENDPAMLQFLAEIRKGKQ
jgi:hypothetical protein